MGSPGGSDSKESVFNAGNPGSVPGLGRSPGEGNGSPFQYSCLKNSMDRGVWQATESMGVTKRVGHNLATKQQKQKLYLNFKKERKKNHRRKNRMFAFFDL